MKNSKVIFDVQARAGVVAITKMDKNNPQSVTAWTTTYDTNYPSQVAVSHVISNTLQELLISAQEDPTVKGRYTIIVPEAIAPRFYEAQKCVNNGINISQKLFKPSWMNREEYFANVIDKDGNAQRINVWQTSIDELAPSLSVMMRKDTGWSLNFFNSRTLYRYELISAGNNNIEDVLENGDKISLKNGVNEALNIVCRDTSFLDGTYTVTRRDVRDRMGNVKSHFYVPRLLLAVSETTGERKYMTVSDLLQDNSWYPAWQNGVLLLNAAVLRIKTAELLPRLQVPKDIKVVQVSS